MFREDCQAGFSDSRIPQRPPATDFDGVGNRANRAQICHNYARSFYAAKAAREMQA
jgi:hypothetical protein